MFGTVCVCMVWIISSWFLVYEIRKRPVVWVRIAIPIDPMEASRSDKVIQISLLCARSYCNECLDSYSICLGYLMAIVKYFILNWFVQNFGRKVVIALLSWRISPSIDSCQCMFLFNQISRVIGRDYPTAIYRWNCNRLSYLDVIMVWLYFAGLISSQIGIKSILTDFLEIPSRQALATSD